MGWVLVFDLDETLIGTTKTYKNGKYYIDDIQLNDKLFQIIFHAKALKPGLVDAILLLTNNTNVPSEYGNLCMGFLDIIDLVVIKKYSKGFDEIFDNIYTGTANNMKERGYNLVPFRPFGNKVSSAYSLNIVQGSTTYNPRGHLNESASGNYKMFNYRPRKDIATVSRMLRDKGISTDNLKNRIFFFDDEPRPHVLKEELEGHVGKYVTIDPPFGKGEDKTDLSGVYIALGMGMPQAKGGARLRRSRRRTARRKQKQRRRTKKY